MGEGEGKKLLDIHKEKPHAKEPRGTRGSLVVIDLFRGKGYSVLPGSSGRSGSPMTMVLG